MDALSAAAFEERAAAAEARLAILEAKVSAGGQQALPSNVVSELLELKKLLLAAKDQTDQLAKERDEAVSMKAALEAENSKLQYRVKHLVRAVQETESNVASA